MCPACGAEVPEDAGTCPACRKTLSDAPVWRVTFPSEDSLCRHYERTLVHHGLVVPRARAEVPDTTVRLHLVLPDARGDLWLMGRVVGVNDRPERPRAPYDIQLELTDIDAQALAALAPGGPAPQSRPNTDRSPPAPRRGGPAASHDLDAFVDELLRRRRIPPPDEPELSAERPPPEPETRACLPEELARELTEFTTRFVRAVTKSSYYTAEHQEAGKAKLGIYRAFTALVAGHPEVTFYARRAGERFTLLVYGVFEEPADLARAMMPGQAELYIPKLAHYFESNAIVSISLKPSLGEDDFHRFIDVLASPGGSGSIAERLAARRIHDISVVVADDQIRGHGLSWRVEMALTRLKKDLSVIPLYEHLSEEELAQIRLQVFRDVLRPLRHVDLIRELLENCDRFIDEVEEFAVGQLAEIEAQVLASVPDDLLPPLLEGFADDIGAAKTEGSDELERLLRLARRVVEQLRPEQARTLEDAFRKLLAEHVLEPEELPELLRRKFTIERDAHHFCELRERILERLDLETQPRKYQALLDHFESILPELPSRADPAPAVALVDRVAGHRESRPPFPERPALARAWLDRVVHGPVARALAGQLALADKVKRETLSDLCRRLGDEIAPVLIDSLSACDQAGGRQAIAAVLSDLGHASLSPLRGALAREDLPDEARVDLLRVLGAVGGPEEAALLASALSHPDPLVRIEALATACRLAPEAGESHALAALGDGNARVRDAALKLLFERRSPAAELFAFCRRILESSEAGDEALVRRICGGLGGYAQGEGRDRAVALLGAVLVEARAQRSGLWSSFKRSVQGNSGDEARGVAACHALGKLRAREAREVLEDLARHGSPALQRAARHGIELLEAGQI